MCRLQHKPPQATEPEIDNRVFDDYTPETKVFNINDAMKIAAAKAIAGLVSDDELSADYILPKAFDPRVKTAVAEAVAKGFPNLAKHIENILSYGIPCVVVSTSCACCSTGILRLISW